MFPLSKESSLAEIHDTESLMVWLMNRIADSFGSHAILKGGMQLRLVDCPRFTNDLDYVFVPFSSKKAVRNRIQDALMENPGIRVRSSINSKCIRYDVMFEQLKVQVEVNVALHCESQELSTVSLARTKNQQGRIIRVMNFGCALAHKLAAWNERGLVRDLFDVYFMAIILNISPDPKVLKQRLAKIERRTKGAKPDNMTMSDFVRKLKTAADDLTPAKVSNELRDYMSPEELPGLDLKIAGGLRKIIDLLSGEFEIPSPLKL